MRFDLVVFDLDGTLVDSVPDIASALARALGTEGLPPPPEEVASLVGEGARRLVERVVPPGTTTGAVDRVFASYRAEYGAHVCERTRLYDGVVGMLDELRGCALAILSNKPEHLIFGLLDRLELTPRFREVIGEDGAFPRKPSPAALEHLVASTGAGRGRTLMVGDGVPDIGVARAAGTSVAAVTWGYTARERLALERPDALLDTPAQVVGLVLGSSMPEETQRWR